MDFTVIIGRARYGRSVQNAGTNHIAIPGCAQAVAEFLAKTKQKAPDHWELLRRSLRRAHRGLSFERACVFRAPTRQTERVHQQPRSKGDFSIALKIGRARL